MSWWDYGYQISGMANRTTLVDNNTWNNSHIAMVGRAMASNEDDAYEIMQDLGVDYVLGNGLILLKKFCIFSSIINSGNFHFL